MKKNTTTQPVPTKKQRQEALKSNVSASFVKHVLEQLGQTKFTKVNRKYGNATTKVALVPAIVSVSASGNIQTAVLADRILRYVKTCWTGQQQELYCEAYLHPKANESKLLSRLVPFPEFLAQLEVSTDPCSLLTAYFKRDKETEVFVRQHLDDEVRTKMVDGAIKGIIRLLAPTCEMDPKELTLSYDQFMTLVVAARNVTMPVCNERDRKITVRKAYVFEKPKAKAATATAK